jgi:hypothetical protein
MIQSDLHGDMESAAEMPVPRETAQVILEVPFRGVTTMNGPKVASFAAPVGRKVDGVSGYMLGSLWIWRYSRLR